MIHDSIWITCKYREKLSKRMEESRNRIFSSLREACSPGAIGIENREGRVHAWAGGGSEISTLWNSIGWFMMAISHQWRHALPCAQVSRQEQPPSNARASLYDRVPRSPSPPWMFADPRCCVFRLLSFLSPPFTPLASFDRPFLREWRSAG